MAFMQISKKQTEEIAICREVPTNYTYDDIEKLQKRCKTHRNTADQEAGYIAELWKRYFEGQQGQA